MPWICQAFDSRQNSGEIAVRFYRVIVRCFDRIFAGDLKYREMCDFNMAERQ